MLSSKGTKHIQPHCNLQFSYYDLLVRSVESNMTSGAGSIYYEVDPRILTGWLDPSGIVVQGTRPSATSQWFVGTAKGVITYPDCRSRSQLITIEAWSGSIPINVWLLFLCAMFVFTLFYCIQFLYYEKTRGRDIFQRINEGVFDTIRMIFRQGVPSRYQALVLCLIFCHALTVLVCLYENLLTSEIVVPERKKALGFAEFLSLGRILTGVNKFMKKMGIPLDRFKSKLLEGEELRKRSYKPSSQYAELLPQTEHSIKLVLMFKMDEPNCKFFAVQEEFYSSFGFTALSHALRARFLHMSNILLQAGYYQFWMMERVSFQYEIGNALRGRGKGNSEMEILDGSLISIWNLVPLFIGISIMYASGFVILLAENKNAVAKRIKSVKERCIKLTTKQRSGVIKWNMFTDKHPRRSSNLIIVRCKD
jgi:hypothetical protein